MPTWCRCATPSPPVSTVLLCSSSLLPYSETFIAEQARALRQWRPVLVGERRLADGLPLDGLDVRLLLPPGAVHEWGRRLCRALQLPYPPMLARLRGIGAHLMHAHFATNAVDLWPLARALRLPMLVTLHGYDINTDPRWWQAGHGGPLRRSYPRRLRALGQRRRVRFLAVSEAVRRRAIDYGLPADRVAVRYIGVDTAAFRPGGAPLAQRPPRVLFAGRLVEKKGVAHLLHAFAEVRRALPAAELVVAGDGPLREPLQQLAAGLGLPARFAGRLTSAQLRDELAQARVFCLPSVTAANGDAEGFGLVLLEAQACGVPVVSSARGGAQEGLVEGQTGLAFAEGDRAALARHLGALLGDAARAQRMGEAAAAFVRERFDLSRCTEALEADYAAMVA